MSEIREQFLKWQCLIRQRAVRHKGGIPNAGMQPMIKINGSEDSIGPITILISKKDPSILTAQFRFIVKKNSDPKERMDSALKHLAEAHYQKASEFNDALTALFSFNSATSRDLIDKKSVTLGFRYTNHEYILPCNCELLDKADPLFQFTYWHNFMFNPSMPGVVDIVAFLPDWSRATTHGLSDCDRSNLIF